MKMFLIAAACFAVAVASPARFAVPGVVAPDVNEYESISVVKPVIVPPPASSPLVQIIVNVNPGSNNSVSVEQPEVDPVIVVPVIIPEDAIDEIDSVIVSPVIIPEDAIDEIDPVIVAPVNIPEESDAETEQVIVAPVIIPEDESEHVIVAPVVIPEEAIIQPEPIIVAPIKPAPVNVPEILN